MKTNEKHASAVTHSPTSLTKIILLNNVNISVRLHLE